jgi:hypothetical protein
MDVVPIIWTMWLKEGIVNASVMLFAVLSVFVNAHKEKGKLEHRTHPSSQQ